MPLLDGVPVVAYWADLLAWAGVDLLPAIEESGALSARRVECRETLQRLETA